MRTVTIALLIGLATGAQTIAAETSAADTNGAGILQKLEYRTTARGLSGHTTQTLAQLDEGLLLETETSALFTTLRESSRFIIDRGQIVPLEHDYRQSVFGVKREESTRFDWNDGIATWERSGREPRSAEIERGIFDRSLYQLQMRSDLRDGSELLAYWLFDRGRVKEYQFAIVDRELIETGLGDVEAIRVSRVLEAGDDEETSIWFAPDWDYQIVRILHVDDEGARYEMVLQSIETADPASG